MIIIYMTCPEEGAKDIARQLLEKKLVACANIMQPHQSLYYWDGAMHEEQECVVILKTADTLFNKVKECVDDIHPYEVPCLLKIEVKDAHQDFIIWVNNQFPNLKA